MLAKEVPILEVATHIAEEGCQPERPRKADVGSGDLTHGRVVASLDVGERTGQSTLD